MWDTPSFLEVWLRCNTARAWVPCSDPCVRVGSHKRRGALLCGSGGPWCFFDWRRKGNSQGAPTSSTLVAELPRLEVETG